MLLSLSQCIINLSKLTTYIIIYHVVVKSVWFFFSSGILFGAAKCFPRNSHLWDSRNQPTFISKEKIRLLMFYSQNKGILQEYMPSL